MSNVWEHWRPHSPRSQYHKRKEHKGPVIHIASPERWPGPCLEGQQEASNTSLDAVVSKVKDCDIHLQVSPRAERSRKTFTRLSRSCSLHASGQSSPVVCDDPTLCNSSFGIKVTQGPSQRSGPLHFSLPS